MMDEKEIQMKEYDTLRQEIIEQQRSRTQLFIFTITAFGFSLAFVFKSEGLPFILFSFVPYFLIYNLCISTQSNSRHIVSVGTYIRLFIEEENKIPLR